MLAFSLLAIIAVLPWLSQSLYFYVDTSERKCFVEELAKDTMVIGMYRSEQWDSSKGGYIENSALGIHIMVTHQANNHVLKDHKGASSGRVAFTADEPGSYSICFSTNNTGWFSHEKARMYFDLATGDALTDSQDANSKLSDLALRVRDLNHRVKDIRREQDYQRQREAEFRDKSEAVNGHAISYTILQMIVLGMTAVWQMRHLKGFFEAKKLV